MRVHLGIEFWCLVVPHRARGLRAGDARLLVDEPGPVFLIPAVIAGIWLGRVPGLVTGILCAALFAVTREINPAGAAGATVLGTISRIIVYGGIGYLVGTLVERESRLRGALRERERELEELR